MEQEQTVSSQVEPVSPTPQVPKIKNSLVLIMSVLLIVTVAIAGLFYFQIQKLSKELSKYQIQPSPTPLVSPKPSAEAETANWKTYTNTTHDFSFKYPSDWVLNSEGDSNQYNAHLSLKRDKNVIGIMANLDGIGGGPRNVPYEEISLWGKTYYKQYGDINFSTNTKTVDICDSPHGLGVFKMNDKTFMTSLTYPATTEGDKPTTTIAQEFDQILSTFKFTEATPSASPTPH